MGIISEASGRKALQPAAQLVRQQQPVSLEVARAAYEHTLNAKREYAKVLAVSDLLPKAYSRNPANVLWALEYGEALGLSPVVAMLGIHVIEGKPTASAALISGLVRRAGHKLRLRGDDKSATCQIIRADDPDYTFEFTWDMDRAKQAGLTGKDNWRKTPAAMLQARATTECARAACQDVLFGLAYTPEELGSTLTEDELVSMPLEPFEAPPPAAGNPGEPERASRDAVNRVAAAFRLAGWKDEDAEGIRPAISVIIDRPFDEGDTLTAEEAEFVAIEVEGFAEDLPGLQAMLTERRDAQ